MSLPEPPHIDWPYAKDKRSLADYILQPAFKVAFFFLDFTIVRLLSVCYLLPIYLILAAFRSLLPHCFLNLLSLISGHGRSNLINRGLVSRKARESQASRQRAGTFQFPAEAILNISQDYTTIKRISEIWPANREYISVGNIQACVVHEAPNASGTRPSGKKIVLLHGNPSWSFMYRKVR